MNLTTQIQNYLGLLNPATELSRCAAMLTYYEETLADPYATREDAHNAMLAISRLRKQQAHIRNNLK